MMHPGRVAANRDSRLARGGQAIFRAARDRLASVREPTAEEVAADALLRRIDELSAASPFARGLEGDEAHVRRLDAATEALRRSERPVFDEDVAPSPAEPTVRPAVLEGDDASLAEAVGRLRDFAAAPKDATGRIELGIVPAEGAARINQRYAAGGITIDVTGWRDVVDADFVRKALRDHGDAKKEASRGQLALGPDDFARIPDVLRAPDEIVFGGHDPVSGLNSVILSRRLEDGAIYLIEVAQTGRRALSAKTMFKKPVPPEEGGSRGLNADLGNGPRQSSETSREPGQNVGPRPVAIKSYQPATLARIDPDRIAVDADAYQFKGGADALGVTERLRGVERWDELLAGIVVVHERADGRLFIADGHQRLALAQRARAAPLSRGRAWRGAGGARSA